MLFCYILRDLLTADPDEISTRTHRGRATEDEKRHDLSPTEAGADPRQRQTERRSTPRATETTPRDSPAPLASQPRRRSQPSQHSRAPRRDGTRHPAPLFTQLTAPDITPEAPHPPTVSALFAADISAAHERRDG